MKHSYNMTYRMGMDCDKNQEKEIFDCTAEQVGKHVTIILEKMEENPRDWYYDPSVPYIHIRHRTGVFTTLDMKIQDFIDSVGVDAEVIDREKGQLLCKNVNGMHSAIVKQIEEIAMRNGLTIVSWLGLPRIVRNDKIETDLRIDVISKER